MSVSICFNHTIADPDSCWDSTIIALTYWRILLVQFLLLREEVQTLPERDLPSRTPLGDGQWQIAEHIKRVGVVRADWAMQWAPQLAWEQICRERGPEWSAVCFNGDKNNGWIGLDWLSSPTIMLSSLSKCFFHMTAASSDILGEDKKNDQNVLTCR